MIFVVRNLPEEKIDKHSGIVIFVSFPVPGTSRITTAPPTTRSTDKLLRQWPAAPRARLTFKSLRLLFGSFFSCYCLWFYWHKWWREKGGYSICYDDGPQSTTKFTWKVTSNSVSILVLSHWSFILKGWNGSIVLCVTIFYMLEHADVI